MILSGGVINPSLLYFVFGITVGRVVCFKCFFSKYGYFGLYKAYPVGL